MAGGVLCALDRSSEAARVAAAAADVAGQLGLRLVVTDAGGSRVTGTPDSRDERRSSLERSEAFLEGIATAAGLQGAELRVETGEPVKTLLELAAREDAELIVVGRGGDTWHEVVVRAACPVLVVPAWQPEAVPQAIQPRHA